MHFKITSAKSLDTLPDFGLWNNFLIGRVSAEMLVQFKMIHRKTMKGCV